MLENCEMLHLILYAFFKTIFCSHETTICYTGLILINPLHINLRNIEITSRIALNAENFL